MEKTRQKGFTLVELLVALGLGILLLSIVVAIYLGSKSTFNTATGVARSQEATRFAVHFLKRDIRLSGFTECSSGIAQRNLVDDSNDAFPQSLNNFIFGWEFAGTDLGDSYDLDYEKLGNSFTAAELNTVRNNNSAGAGSWVGNYIQGIPGTNAVVNLPATIAGLNPLKGSDILMVSVSEPLDIKIAPVRNQRNLVLEVVDSLGLDAPSNVEPGTMLKIGDCAAADTFQNQRGATESEISPAGGSTGAPGNLLTRAFKWQKKWDQAATVYEASTIIYFVGTGASGKPALFRYDTKCGIAPGCNSNTSELIEGVESMQLLYGEDIAEDGNPGRANRRDGIADIYRSADDVVDFRDVVSVKVGLVVRSPDVGREDPNFPDQVVLDRITINPPDDRVQRFVNNTTVIIHNRGQ